MDYQYLKQFRREEVTVVHFLEWRAAADPEGVFFTWDDEVHTFADFNTSANRTARNLANVGIQQRTRVLVLMDTSPDYLRLWFALAKAGAVEVPVNSAYHGEILLHQLSLSAAEVAIVDVTNFITVGGICNMLCRDRRKPTMRTAACGSPTRFRIPRRCTRSSTADSVAGLPVPSARPRSASR